MPSDRRAWLVAIVATLAMTVSYADRQVMAAIGTSLRQSLAMPAESCAWLAAAFSAAYLVATPLAGTVLDRIGPRVGLAIAVIAWSSVSAAHAMVSSFGALLAMRIALGVAEAPSFPGAALSVRRVMPPEARSTAFGLIFTGSSLGAALVAPLAVALDAVRVPGGLCRYLVAGPGLGSLLACGHAFEGRP
jgi:ACS family hexuronate transporter-like MFS transporter